MMKHEKPPVRRLNCHSTFAIFPLLAAMSLTACASFWLSGGLPLLKIAPATLGARTVEQRLTLFWSGEQKTLEMALDIHADTLTVVGMAFGARLFSFDYDGKKIIETQPLPAGLSATRIVNDLMLIYAPLDALCATLPSGWTVQENEGLRQVFLNDALNISIRYDEGSQWQGRAVFENHALRYHLTLESHEAEPDAP